MCKLITETLYEILIMVTKNLTHHTHYATFLGAQVRIWTRAPGQCQLKADMVGRQVESHVPVKTTEQD